MEEKDINGQAPYGGRTAKETIRKIWDASKGAVEAIVIFIFAVSVLVGVVSFIIFIYQDSNRMAVEVQHQGIVKKSEIIFVPAHYYEGKELPAKVVNYLEVECKEDSVTFKLAPAYLNEFIQEGDTVTVYTYYSKVYNLESGIVRYRWDGELYE